MVGKTMCGSFLYSMQHTESMLIVEYFKITL